MKHEKAKATAATVEAFEARLDYATRLVEKCYPGPFAVTQTSPADDRPVGGNLMGWRILKAGPYDVRISALLVLCTQQEGTCWTTVEAVLDGLEVGSVILTYDEERDARIINALQAVTDIHKEEA